MNPVQKRAFTTVHKGMSLTLKNDVIVVCNGQQVTAKALWDTGATGTVISENIVRKLNLIATGKNSMKTPSGEDIVNTYLVDIVLPNQVVVNNVIVCDSKIGDQGIDVLVGMNIITLGDFAVSNFHGSTVFSFRVPSVKKTDYVQEVKLEQIIGPRHGQGKRKKK